MYPMYRSFVSDVLRSFLSDLQTPTETSNFSISLGGDRNLSLSTRTTPEGHLKLVVGDGRQYIQLAFVNDPRKVLTTPMWLTYTDKEGRTSNSKIDFESFRRLKVDEKLQPLHQACLRLLHSLNPALAQALTPAELDKDAAPAHVGANAAEPQAPTEGVQPEAAHAVPAAPQEPEFRTWMIHRPDAPDLKFEGRVVANASTEYRNGRARQLVVFETRLGKLVALTLGLSYWPNEHTRVKVEVADNREGLLALLGYNVLSKAVYEQLGIQALETLE